MGWGDVSVGRGLGEGGEQVARGRGGGLEPAASAEPGVNGGVNT